jgi:hypothetical protein
MGAGDDARTILVELIERRVTKPTGSIHLATAAQPSEWERREDPTGMFAPASDKAAVLGGVAMGGFASKRFNEVDRCR